MDIILYNLLVYKVKRPVCITLNKWFLKIMGCSFLGVDRRDGKSDPQVDYSNSLFHETVRGQRFLKFGLVPPTVMGFVVHSKDGHLIDYILSANSDQLASSFANPESILLANFN